MAPSDEEEVDNLFGEEEETNDQAVVEQGSDENDDDGGIFGDEDEDEATEQVEETFRTQSTTIPRYPRSHSAVEDTCYLKVPPFLTVEPKPFNAEEFLKKATDATEDERVRLHNENTVRWKYARDANGNMTKQSNARFVRWSDGTMSLQLGNEIFDASLQAPYEHTFLTISHPSSGILQTAALLKQSMSLMPTSTSSLTHKRLAEELAKRQLSKSTVVGSIATIDDPEKMQREVGKNEAMKLRARRKLESKQKASERRSAGSAMRERYTSGEPVATAASRDEYEEDDFVVEDEDEEEEPAGSGDEDGEDIDDLSGEDNEEEDDEEAERERAQRLQAVKNRGAELYSKRAEDTGDESGSGTQRKKRRVIDDDDDDDE